MISYLERREPPSDDKRWKIIAATMRKLGNQRNALIEALHSMQQAFGYLDKPGLTFIASTLRLPLSQVYGAATFYHYFTMKPQGEHTCVVCTGTACHIKGAPELLKAVTTEAGIRKTGFAPVTSRAAGDVADTFTHMRSEAIAEFSSYGYAEDQIQWETWVEMRYRGQGFELPLEIELDALAVGGRDYLNRVFHQAHRSRYGTVAPNDNIELVSYRLVAHVPSEWPYFEQIERALAPSFERPAETGRVLFAGEKRSCQFVRRATLPLGQTLSGLAIVEDATATTLVPPGWRLTVSAGGALLLEREDRA